MKKEMIWRGILFLLSILFMLSALGYVNLVDYNKVADLIGISDRAQTSGAIYTMVIVIIAILFLVVNFIFAVISYYTKKSYKTMYVGDKVNKNLIIRIYDGKNNSMKVMIGIFVSLILLRIFLWLGIFTCFNVPIQGGFAQYCGTEKQLTFLIVSMIFLAYALLPKEIAKKKKGEIKLRNET